MRISLEAAVFAAEVAKTIREIEKRHGDFHVGEVPIMCAGGGMGLSIVTVDDWYELEAAE